MGYTEQERKQIRDEFYAWTNMSPGELDEWLTQVSQSTHGILRKLLHDLTLSRRAAGLKVSQRIPLRFS